MIPVPAFNIPTVLITTPNNFIPNALEILESDWLYAIDFEALVSVVFDCVRDCHLVDPKTLVMDYVLYVLESTSTPTPRQIAVITEEVYTLTDELHHHLDKMGLLHHAVRPFMRFVKILPDSSLQIEISQMHHPAV